MQLPAGLPVDRVLLILYHYVPSRPAAIAAVVLYAVISILVTGISIKTRSYFMLTVAVTGFLELAGWSTRLVMLDKPEFNTYIIHQALLIISPVLLAIVEYITLGKLLDLGSNNSGISHSHGHSVAPAANAHNPTVRRRTNSTGGRLGTRTCCQRPSFAKTVKWFFTCSDIFCLLLQSTGGAMYANPENAAKARILLLIGLGAQLVFFSAFIILTVCVQFTKRYGFKGDRSFRPVFICLYATTLLMHLRNSFRVAEFAQGFEGDLGAHEMYLYIFDFMPIYACFLFFTFMHYGFWLGPQAPAMLARQDGKRDQLPVIHIQAD